MRSYGFDPAWEGERDRMALAASVLDEVTVGHLRALGVGEGSRCLEVGAGAGSVARWMGRATGPSGRVVATDIDTRFLDALAVGDGSGHGPGRVEVHRHDIVTDPPLEAAFDVVHTRLVLQHLPARQEAVRRMAAALVPGGRLLVEEFDFVSSAATTPRGARTFARVERAIHRLLAVTGFDPACGRHLPGLLAAAGLEDVEADGRLFIVPGGSPLAVWYARSVEALRGRILDAGFVTDGEVDRAVALLEDPGFSLMSPVLVSARGRRPE